MVQTLDPAGQCARTLTRQVTVGLLAVLLPSGGMARAEGACPATKAFDFPDPSLTGPVREGPTKTLIFTGKLRVNTDGAPNSYHPFGRKAGATNVLCNGLAVQLPGGARLSAKTDKSCSFITRYYEPTRDSGWKVQPGFKIDWYAIPTLPPKDGRYRPCIQQSGPYKGFFVSQTAISTGIGDVCDPAHWVNSETIPYITLPRASKDFAAYKAKLGDVALVHANLGSGPRWVAAVVADVGNTAELGEGSLALHRALGSKPGNMQGVTTVLFPGVRAPRPITAESLAALKPDLERRVGDLAACLPK